MQFLLTWLAAFAAAGSQFAPNSTSVSSEVASASPQRLFARQDTYSTSPLPVATEGSGYLPAPISQPSVTSTEFNPAETNAGGTTNSAGTFNVVSLSRSSDYSFNSDALPQTTTFAPSSASYLSKETVTGDYNTNTGSAQYGAQVDTTVTNPLPNVGAGTGTAGITGGAQENAAVAWDSMLGSWKQITFVGAGVIMGVAIVL